MKKHIISYIILSLLLSVAAFQPVSAAVPTVKARLDSVQLLMGRLTNLHLEVVHDKNKAGGFPMLQQGGPDGIIGVCGDSVELRTSVRIDTVDIGSGKVQYNYTIPVQAFDSGMYRLPEFVYVSGTDTARSNRLSLKVIPVNVGADEPIADYAPTADPEGKSIFDIIPDFIVDYWLIWLLVLLLIAILIYAWTIYKKRGSLLPPKPLPTPYEVAIGALRRLKERKLWENGMEREYFTELTDILRVYMEGRFGINAMEMTTRQIIQKLSANPEVKDKKEYMREILDMADFVKFAKATPMAEDNVRAYDKAISFVEETKPEEIADPDASKDSDSENAQKGGKQ